MNIILLVFTIFLSPLIAFSTATGNELIHHVHHVEKVKEQLERIENFSNHMLKRMFQSKITGNPYVIRL